MRADIGMVSTIDFDGLERRLLDSERRVFVRHEKKILGAFKSPWKGWEYEGRKKGLNVSRKAWKSKVETTEGKAVLRIFNEARTKYGKGYAAYVHRSGATEIEWEKLAVAMQADLLPPLIEDLTEEVKKNAFVKGPKRKLAGRGGGTTVKATGTSL